MNGRTAKLLRFAAHGRNNRPAKRAYNALTRSSRARLRAGLTAARNKLREASHA